jgi:V8-like Glu-specific endopeptidase
MTKAATYLLAAVLAGALATPAAAAPKKNPQSPEETAAYWTAERMKNAKPRERVKPGGGAGGGAQTDWLHFAVPLAGSTYGSLERTNGKAFFTLKGANYVCSGTAVTSSAGVNLVWTAGHCVTDGASADKFASRFLFVPGYYKGQKPFGEWAYTQLDSTPGWEAQGSTRFRYDVGAARVQKVGDGSATFASAGVGTRSVTFGLNPSGERIVSYGYPAAGKFNGSQQYACASPFRRWDDAALLDPMQISCDMTGGSSGGGWFHDANANNYADSGEPLMSVNSYGYQFEKNTMYGPYMAAGGQAQDLYDALD